MQLFLKEYKYFRDVKDRLKDDWHNFLASLEIKFIDPRRELITRDDKTHQFYLILKGQCLILKKIDLEFSRKDDPYVRLFELKPFRELKLKPSETNQTLKEMTLKNSLIARAKTERAPILKLRALLAVFLLNTVLQRKNAPHPGAPSHRNPQHYKIIRRLRPNDHMGEQQLLQVPMINVVYASNEECVLLAVKNSYWLDKLANYHLKKIHK